jgi:hypothetical protein
MWIGEFGFNRFVRLLNGTPLVLQLTKEEWIQQKIKLHSIVPVLCSKCGIVSMSTVKNVASKKRVGCICTGRFKYNTPNGRIVLKQLIDKSRFKLVKSIEDVDLSNGCYSRIELCCSFCDATVHPGVYQLHPKSYGIGCPCAQPDEMQIHNALKYMIRIWNNDRKIELQFKFFGQLKGPKGKPFRADFAIVDKDGNVLAIIEVDGWYHFNEYKKGRITDINRSKEHDLMKERWCLERKIPMVRISTSFIKRGIDAWWPSFWTTVNDVCNGEGRLFSRLSHDCCYVSGSYFDRRIGTVLEVDDDPVFEGDVLGGKGDGVIYEEVRV